NAAVEHYPHGLQQAERLVELNSRSPGGKHALGVSHEKLGTAAARRGEVESARQHYAKALESMRPLAKDDPDNLSLLGNLALLLARSGSHGEAAKAALE